MDKKLKDRILNGASYGRGTEEDRAMHKSDGQKVVESQKCVVCAKGAVLLSWAANFDQVSIGTLVDCSGDKQDVSTELDDIFPEEMWDAMESAFENGRWKLEQVMNWMILHEGDFPYDEFYYCDGEQYWDREIECDDAPTRYPRNPQRIKKPKP